MNDLLILRRIGENKKYYIIDSLDLSTKKTKLVLYDKEKESLDLEIAVTKEIYNSCFDYITNKILKYEDKILESKNEINGINLELNDYIIHKFNEDIPNLRSIKYTIKNINTNQLFTPCCGRHKNHEEFKKWGQYITNLALEEYCNMEGYQIIDGNVYDRYILSMDLLKDRSVDPQSMVLDLSLVNLFLIRELSDYVKDLFVTTSDQVDIKITYKSGRVIEVKL